MIRKGVSGFRLTASISLEKRDLKIGQSCFHSGRKSCARNVQHSGLKLQFGVNLLTAWCRLLLEQLTGLQLVKKFPAFHGTRRFITALTSVRQLSLSWASPIQSIYPHPISWRSIQILSTHLRLGLPSGLFPSGFPTKTLYTPFSSPNAPHAQPISFISILSPAQYWVRSTKFGVKQKIITLYTAGLLLL